MTGQLAALQIGMTASPKRSGGLDRYYFGLLKGLETCNIESRGLVAGTPNDIAAHGIAGVESFARDDASLLVRWAGLRAAVKRRLPGSDLVVSHFAPYTFPILDRIRSHPVMIHYHGSWARESQAEGAHGLSFTAKRTLERLVYRGGAGFVVLTNAVSHALQRDFKVSENLIRVIPGGVDIECFHPAGSRAEARTALGLPLDRPIVVTARRLVQAKGIESLIDAVALVRKRIPDVLLVIVGTGPQAAALRAFAKLRDMERSIRFTGFLTEEALRSAYRAADLSVVPTIAVEGFGLVVIEALACGTPAMVTPVDGLPETVSGLDPNLVFESARPDAVGSGILGALNGSLRLPSPAECRAYAERFAWPDIASRVHHVYEGVA